MVPKEVNMIVKSLAAAAAVLSMSSVHAAEIKVFASNGVKAALEELAPAFERQTGNKLSITFGLAAVLKRQIENGTPFDYAILTDAGIADLVKQGKVDGASRVAIALSGVGIGIKKGAPRADIGTPDALKRALLDARSIAWAKEGQSGIYFAGLLERMGIADQMKPKVVPAASGAEVGKLVVEGKSQYGVILVNELMAIPGVEVLGPLPAEVQSYTAFHGAAAASSKNAAAAWALSKFLTVPAARDVFKAKGQEPG